MRERPIRVLPVIGPQKEAQRIWEKLLELGAVVEDRENSEYILVLGGDGTFLGAERDYYKMQVPFVGFGFGTLNFLLNQKFSSAEDILNILQRGQWEECCVFGIKAKIETDNGTEECIAFNDVYIKSTDPTSSAHVQVSAKECPDSGLVVSGDGVIIATPQGSTAYNRNAGGTILPLNSSLWCLTGICDTRKLHVTIDKQEIRLNNERGELVVVGDNQKFFGMKRARVFPSKYEVKILFALGENFEKRRYNL
ncbi:NAD(+)/NADH kinase [Patescibacteria group bacterium]